MDTNLLPTWDKANEGQIDAILEMAQAYIKGNGVPYNISIARELLEKGVNTESKELSKYEYGEIFALIGYLCFGEGNMEKSNFYYQQAKHYIWENYEDDFAQELCDKYELDFWINETTTEID